MLLIPSILMISNSSFYLVSSLIFQSLCIDHGNPYLRQTDCSVSLVRETANTAELRPSLPGLCLKLSTNKTNKKKKTQNATEDLLLNASKTEIPTRDDIFSLFQVSDSTITLLSQTLNCLSKSDNVECSLTLKPYFFFPLPPLVKTQI